MMTLLQTLLLRALPLDLDLVLLDYIKKVLPAVEEEFGIVAALHTSKYDLVVESGVRDATRQFNDVLNSLLIAWNLLPLLDVELDLSNECD